MQKISLLDRWLPHPFVSFLVFLSWLMLSHSVDPTDILMALLLAIVKLVLGPLDHLHPKWYRVPLETEHEQINTLLAMIITTTPGTVSAGIDQERGDILVHALSTDDTELDIQDIKKRYEMPLIEIFDVKLNKGASK